MVLDSDIRRSRDIKVSRSSRLGQNCSGLDRVRPGESGEEQSNELREQTAQPTQSLFLTLLISASPSQRGRWGLLLFYYLRQHTHRYGVCLVGGYIRRKYLTRRGSARDVYPVPWPGAFVRASCCPSEREQVHIFRHPDVQIVRQEQIPRWFDDKIKFQIFSDNEHLWREEIAQR